ncbi:MAG: hypothetical protein ABIN67_02930 [Ferruginibacter sp.]
MTTPNDNEWEIESLRTRYKAMNSINLSNEQAEKVLRYEHERDSGSFKYFFSAWEELDYEQVKFQEILTSSQFENYAAERFRQLKEIENRLIENDKQSLPQLNAARERLVYYKNILVPALGKTWMVLYTVFNSEKEKVAFLKSEYKKYLGDAKKQMLVEHFRHSKTFQPVILELSLLLHEQKCLFPDYFSFKATMDIATKGVADYLLEKLTRIAEDLSETLKATMEDLKEFNTKNNAKHIGEMRGGWSGSLPINNKTEELMFVVLLDTGMYTR